MYLPPISNQPIQDPGGGGDGDVGVRPGPLTLEKVTTTSYGVGEGDSPQLQAVVTNDGEEATATVRWFYGQTQVAQSTETVPAHGEETLAERVPWSDVRQLAPGDYTLRGELLAGGNWGEQSDTYGNSMRLSGPNSGSGGNNDGGGDPSTPSGPLAGLPTLPGIGPLTGVQTTGLAALLVVGVLLR